MWSAEWQTRPGFAGALQIRQRKRPEGTQKVCDVKVRLWQRFNAEGNGRAARDHTAVLHLTFLGT